MLHGTEIFTYIYHKVKVNWLLVNTPYMEHLGISSANKLFRYDDVWNIIRQPRILVPLK